MEPRQPVQITVNVTAAELLARLAVDMGTDDPSAVVARALGLLDMAHRARQQGGRLMLVNARGETSDVAF